jgi:hypothetical protein
MRFRTVVRWEIMDDFSADLEVVGTYYSSPGNRRGHPDTWSAPFCEIYVDEIRDARTGALFPDSVISALALDDDFAETVERALHAVTKRS